MRFVPGLLIALFVSTTAMAETVRATVPPNKATVVGSGAIYGPDCSAGMIPEFKVKQEPKHGKVSFKLITRKLGEGAGRCAGKTVKGMLVIYQPDKGYKGEDVFKAGFVMNMYTSGAADIRHVVNKYVIQVK
ncbi:hypothetical protein [Roseibium sp. M-1]